jgi:hypothetical protein
MAGKSKRAWRSIGVSFALLAVGLTGWVLDAYWHRDHQVLALRSAGHGELVLGRARHANCPAGYASSTFITQGGPARRETSGYVCTSHFGRPIVREEPLAGDDYLDWD